MYRCSLCLTIALALLNVGIAWSDESPKPASAEAKHVDPQAAQKLILEKKVVVLDVRTPAEFKQVHIAGATNLDFLAPDFESRLVKLDTNKTYLVHCASGGRSTHCLPVLKKHQFEMLYHLDGGIKAWEKAGLPVEKSP
jgi:phage shock protein E